MAMVVVAAAVSLPCALTVNVPTAVAEPYAPAVTAVAGIESLIATWLVTPPCTIGNTSVPARGVVAAGNWVIFLLAIVYSYINVAATVPLITTYSPLEKKIPPSDGIKGYIVAAVGVNTLIIVLVVVAAGES
jgi:hypothetical protein